MTKVTYLFGAGASANALPVVNELPKRIKELAKDWIEGENRNRNLLLPENEYFDGLPHRSKREFQRQMLNDLEWLSLEADPRKHASVDTLAKKLFLKENWLNKGDKKLRLLKNTLSMFFMLEQTRVSVDTRYDTFYASILNVDRKPEKIQLNLPENIRIISWNYDYQFEKVFSDYVEKHDLEEIQGMLNVVSKYSKTKPESGFSIVKLNGTTTFSGEGKLKDLVPLSNITVQFDLDTVSALTNYYALAVENPKSYYPNLSFAWEGEGSESETVADKAIACTKDTEILVVIGYSFPFFNREVDRKIIGAMKSLSKVYFQAPDAENIKTRFQAVRNNMLPKDLVAYPEVKDFLLPDEL